jgi:hypothetical protein
MPLTRMNEIYWNLNVQCSHALMLFFFGSVFMVAVENWLTWGVKTRFLFIPYLLLLFSNVYIIIYFWSDLFIQLYQIFSGARLCLKVLTTASASVVALSEDRSRLTTKEYINSFLNNIRFLVFCTLYHYNS